MMQQKRCLEEGGRLRTDCEGKNVEKVKLTSKASTFLNEDSDGFVNVLSQGSEEADQDAGAQCWRRKGFEHLQVGQRDEENVSVSWRAEGCSE